MTFKSVSDPNFKYSNSVSTDVRETFERIRKERELEKDGAVVKTASNIRAIAHPKAAKG